MASLTTSAALYERFQPAERLVLLLEALARRDEAEVERVRRTCPRKTYSQADAAFEDRYDMALDVTVVACGDLKALVAQMRVLREAGRWAGHACTAQAINATMAFLDGNRQGRGLPQTPFFRLGLRDRLRRRNAREGDEDEDGEGNEGDGPETAALGEEFYRRMRAVERRAERWTRWLRGAMRRAEADLAAEMKVIWGAYDAFCRGRLGLPPERVLDAFEYPARAEFAETLARHRDVPADGQAVAEYRDALCAFWDRRIADNE